MANSRPENKVAAHQFSNSTKMATKTVVTADNSNSVCSVSEITARALGGAEIQQGLQYVLACQQCQCHDRPQPAPTHPSGMSPLLWQL